MWFIDNFGDNIKGQLLDETTKTFSDGPNFANERSRACAVQISPTKTAIIGGTLEVLK